MSAPAPRRRVRPVLAVLSLVPLLGAVALAHEAPATQPEAVTRGSAAVAPAAVQDSCPGPLAIPDELLETGGDAALAVTAPTDAVAVRSVALEADSSLLFGHLSASETGRTEEGDVPAPQIDATGADGETLQADAVAGDLGASVLGADGVDGPARVAIAAAGSRAAVSDTLQSTTTPQGDYRSLALSRCAPAGVDAQFLGAATTTGSSASLVMTNDSERPATASVQIATEDGPADMKGRSTVVVAPGTTETVLLESIAPGLTATGVSVTTIGAPLAMHVQSTERDGLTPGGAEIQTPLPAAARDLVVPGVRASAGRDPVAVLLNPGGHDVTADLTAAGPDGPIDVAGASGVTVPAGALVEVPLGGLDAAAGADLTVSVHGDGPLTAVVRSSVAGADLPGDTIGAPVDFSLAPAAGAIGGSAVLALPAEGPAGSLVLAADEDTTATVIPVGADGGAGTPRTVEVTAGSSVSVASSSWTGTTGAPAAVVIVPDEPGVLHGAWVQAPDAPGVGPLLSSVPVEPAATGEGSRSVTAG